MQVAYGYYNWPLELRDECWCVISTGAHNFVTSQLWNILTYSLSFQHNCGTGKRAHKCNFGIWSFWLCLRDILICFWTLAFYSWRIRNNQLRQELIRWTTIILTSNCLVHQRITTQHVTVTEWISIAIAIKSYQISHVYKCIPLRSYWLVCGMDWFMSYPLSACLKLKGVFNDKPSS